MSTHMVHLHELAAIPLFANLDECELRNLAEATETLSFESGETLIREGGDGRNLWVILEGRCEVLKHRTRDGEDETVVLDVLEPFSHFGEMSFFHAAPNSADVRAQSKVRLLRLTRPAFDALANCGTAAPYKVAYNALGCVAERLRRMGDWVTQLMQRETLREHVTEWEEFRRKLFVS